MLSQLGHASTRRVAYEAAVAKYSHTIPPFTASYFMARRSTRAAAQQG